MSTETQPVGRPSLYTPALADYICAQLADGRSLRSVCEDEGMPEKTTIFRWLRENEEFRNQYAKAKDESADSHSDDLLDIADDGRNDWMERQDGEGKTIGWQLNGEHVQRSRLRIDTRKWIASKLKPKVYGDRSAVEMTGKDGSDLIPQTDPEAVARRVAFLLAQGLAAK